MCIRDSLGPTLVARSRETGHLRVRCACNCAAHPDEGDDDGGQSQSARKQRWPALRCWLAYIACLHSQNLMLGIPILSIAASVPGLQAPPLRRHPMELFRSAVDGPLRDCRPPPVAWGACQERPTNRARTPTVNLVHPATSHACLLYTSPSPRDRTRSRMPSSA